MPKRAAILPLSLPPRGLSRTEAAAYVGVYAVMANTNGTAPYRGAGRPEATYVLAFLRLRQRGE